MHSTSVRACTTFILALNYFACGADKNPELVKNESDPTTTQGNAGEKSGGEGREQNDNSQFILQSEAFSAGEEIPTQYTCEGTDISPPLSWSDAPEKTESFVLIVDDPDAPDPQNPKMTWVHLVLYNIPKSTTLLTEGMKNLPRDTGLGLNDWGKTGYGGPCPPIGRHRYFFKIYALDTPLEGLTNPTKAEVESAMEDHILAEAQLIGTYEKKSKI